MPKKRDSESPPPKTKRSVAKTDAEKLAALRKATVAAINDDLKYRAAVNPDQDLLSTPRWAISTGHALIDGCLGGGIREGKVMRFRGPPGVGKTSLLMSTMLRAMEVGAIVAYVDVESTFDMGRVEQLAAARGITWNPGLFIPIEPMHIGDVFSAVHAAMRTAHPIPKTWSQRPAFERPLVFFLDTQAATPSPAEHASTLDKKSRGGGMGERARKLHEEARKIGNSLALHGAAFVISDQEIIDIGGSKLFISKIPTGGSAFSYRADQDFTMDQSSAMTDPSGQAVGHIVRCKTIKTRFIRPKAVFKLMFYYDRGFDERESNVDFLEGAGVLKTIKDDDNMLVLPTVQQLPPLDFDGPPPPPVSTNIFSRSHYLAGELPELDLPITELVTANIYRCWQNPKKATSTLGLIESAEG